MTIYVKDGRTLQQACKDSGVTFWQVYDKMRYYDYTPDQAIKYCVNIKKTYMCYGKTLRQYCIENNIPYQSVINYHNDGGKESFEDIVDKKLFRKNNYTDYQFCKDFNINYNNAKARHYYAIYVKNCQQSFKEFCKDCYKL